MRYQGLHGRADRFTQHSNFSIFNIVRNYRFNPPIRDGRLQGTLFNITIDTRQFIDAGWLEVVDKTQNSWNINFQIEYTDTKLFKSDFDFGRLLLNIHRREHSFGANFIDIFLSLGYSLNGIPPQRLFDLISNTSGLSRLGMFKTAYTKEFAGDAYSALFVEYNFGTMLFRALHLPFIQNLDFIIQSNAGWSTLSSKSEVLQTIAIKTAKKPFFEAGFAIGKILSFIRFDFMWRLTHQNTNNFAITLQSSLD